MFYPLHPIQVFAGAGVDADAVAGVDEDGDGDFDASFDLGLLGDVGGGVAADAGRGFEDLEVNGGREFEFGNLAFDFGQGAAQVFGEVVLGIADKLLVESDCLIRFRVHEMEAGLVLVTEIHGLGVLRNDDDRFGRRKTDNG